MIVGIDPGATSAIAVLDLKGNIISINSERNLGKDKLIEMINSKGTPLIFSSDRANAPAIVKKISANFNGILCTPEIDMKTEEKNEIIKNLENIKLSNDHEKDALSAALFAYKKYQNQFRKVDDALESFSLQEHSDKVKEMILRKQVNNISDALQRIIEPKQMKVEISHKAEEAKEDPLIREYRRRLEIQKDYIEKLEEKIRKLEAQKNALIEEEKRKNQESRDRILKEKEIRARDVLIKQLIFEIKKIKYESRDMKKKIEMREEIEEIEYEGLEPIIIIDEFDKEKIAETNIIFPIQDKVVCFRKYKFSNSAARYLVLLKPKAVILQEKNEILLNAGIPVLTNVDFKIFGNFGGIEKDYLKSLLKDHERGKFIGWLEKYKNRQK